MFVFSLNRFSDAGIFRKMCVPSVAIILSLLSSLIADAQAQAHGHTYCFNGFCHRAMALNAMSGSLFAPAAGSAMASAETPLEGLKAAARRAYGVEPSNGERREAPSSLLADARTDTGTRAGAGYPFNRDIRLVN